MEKMRGTKQVFALVAKLQISPFSLLFEAQGLHLIKRDYSPCSLADSLRSKNISAVISAEK